MTGGASINASALFSLVAMAFASATGMVASAAPATDAPAPSGSGSTAPEPTGAAPAAAHPTQLPPATDESSGVPDGGETGAPGEAAEPSTDAEASTGTPSVTDGTAQDESPPPVQTPFDELPENPELKVLPQEAERPPAPSRQRRRLEVELGGRIGVSHRPSSNDAVTYEPGLSYGAHVTLVIASYLGINLIAALEDHAVDISRDALGFSDLEASQPDLRVVRIGAEIEPRLRLSNALHLALGVGFGWNRLEAEPLTATEPVPFELSRRSGVLLEAALSPRVHYRPFRRVGFSLFGGFALPLNQTGGLFSSPDSDLQTVRRDTGQLLSVGGFPDSSYALSSHLSVDVLF